MKKIPLTIIFIISFKFLFAQTLYDKVWVQGAGVSFTTTFNGTAVNNAYLDTMFSPYFATGHSNICNKDGNFILCSDGYNVYNNQTILLDNGDSIVPKEIMNLYSFTSLSQSSIFLPFPNNKYYLITPTASDTNVLNNWFVGSTYAIFDLMLYNVIDMNANGGQGKVVKKGIPFLQSTQLSKVGMMACRHGNGKDWWLFKQGIMSNTVYKFLVTEDSIYNYGTQYFPAPLFNQFDQSGQMMFSPDGHKYASTIRGNFNAFVADFDRCTGILSNPKVYPVNPSSCHNIYDTSCYENYTQGLCFSPNGRFLYVSTYDNIKQLDLLDNDTNTQWSYIHGIDTVWDYFNTYSSIYLGPNDKLYIGHYNGLGDAMSVINSPNVKGIACNFCELCCPFPKYGSTDPPCMPNYHLGAAPVGGTCWPLGSSAIIEWNKEIKVYPNPVSTVMVVETQLENTSQILGLYNVFGQLVNSYDIKAQQTRIEINMSHFSNGLYYLKCDCNVIKILKE